MLQLSRPQDVQARAETRTAGAFLPGLVGHEEMDQVVGGGKGEKMGGGQGC